MWSLAARILYSLVSERAYPKMSTNKAHMHTHLEAIAQNAQNTENNAAQLLYLSCFCGQPY